MASVHDTEPTSARQEPEVHRYLRIFTERRWVILASLIIAAVIYAVWASRQPRIYQVTATIVVEPSAPQVLGGDVRDVVQVGPGQYYALQDYIQTQRRVLTSDSLARRVIERLKLQEDREFWLGNPPRTMDDAVAQLTGGLSSEPVLDTQLVSISFRHQVPAQAKRLVDGLVDAYIDSNLDQRDTSTLLASRFLADEADSLRARLGAAELALYEFKQKNDLLSVALEDRINNVSRQVEKLSDALTEARVRKATRASEADELERMAKDDSGAIAPAQLTVGMETLGSLKKDLADEERRLSELKARYEDPHPLVRQQAAKVAAVESALKREVQLQVRGAQARTNEATDQEKKIGAQLEQAKQEGLRVTRLEIEYNKLKREYDSLSKQYLLVQNRTKETELAGKIRTNNLRVLDYARLPTAPVSPHLTRAAMVAGVLGLLVGVLLALLLDALDRSLKTPEDVESKLAVPFLGVMPHVDVGEGRLDLYVAENPQSPASECCRLIRTNLLFAGLSRPLKRILVTSPVAREGKTTMSISLAVVMAQAGNKVLLIDSDLRRPRLKAALGPIGVNGKLEDVGLTSALLGTVPLDQAIQATSVPNLFVLLSGPVPPNPAELVDGVRFREVVEECAEKFERLIIDSPPAVPVTDPAILASYCDGVVMVVRAGRTAEDQAMRARRNLTDVGARILGVVLNDCELSRRGYGAYRYGYGSYGAKTNRGSSRSRRATG
jgi:capsular exopolysaccharide synthesis family protein